MGGSNSGNFYGLLALRANKPLTGQAASGSQFLVAFGAEKFECVVRVIGHGILCTHNIEEWT